MGHVGMGKVSMGVRLTQRAEREGRGARWVLVVLLQRRWSQPGVMVDWVLSGTPVRQLPHLHILVYYVIRELCFLVASRRHALLAGSRRVW